MTTVDVPNHGIPAVEEFGRLLIRLLDDAERIKVTTSIEPPLASSDFEDLKSQVTAIFNRFPSYESGLQNAIIETAVRNIFGQLIARTEITSPEFVKVWNLLDIVSLLCDSGQCDTALTFWLVEELLDSQTISGCRIVFDFLESRRERLTSKDFKLSKSLVILRSCNELLRRLSRAEDTTFCGRVFIFLFQSFPLGDKSSVNLRGEYHIENVTTFDAQPTRSSEKMDVDSGSTAKGDGDDEATTEPTQVLDTDSLYPIFWSLQAIFSQPKRLFDDAELDRFKISLEATLKAMRAYTVRKGGAQHKASDENKQGAKTQQIAGAKGACDKKEGLSSGFNPKYLTNRDLFDLQISDLSFQRHVLVQALIVMDFLIHLSEPEKEKLEEIAKPNLSVRYKDYTLSREDTQWAMEMRKKIHDFLTEGWNDGPFFYRMVDSILSRDKNWVRWKLEGCPPIQLPGVSADTFASSKATIANNTKKRPRPSQPGSMNLDFLQKPDPESMWEKYKDPKRYKVPDVQAYKAKISDAKFDFDMAVTGEDRAQAEEVIAAQTWRAMRIAASMRIEAFDQIEDYKNIDSIFKEPAGEEEEEMSDHTSVPPVDTRLVVVSGPQGVGRATLINKVIESRPGVFKLVSRLTSRHQADGEVQGQAHDFVSKSEINAPMDRDQIIEFEDIGEHTYGTNRAKVDSIRETGKVPILRLGPRSAQSIKDWDYPARFIFVMPPDLEELQTRLRKGPGLTDREMAQCLKEAEQQVKDSKEGSLFDALIVNDSLDNACRRLIDFVYGDDLETGNESPDSFAPKLRVSSIGPGSFVSLIWNTHTGLFHRQQPDKIAPLPDTIPRPRHKLKMGGINLEVFKFGIYLLFPIGIMYYFGTNLDDRFVVHGFWPTAEQGHKFPREAEGIKAELERQKTGRLAWRDLKNERKLAEMKALSEGEQRKNGNGGGS